MTADQKPNDTEKENSVDTSLIDIIHFIQERVTPKVRIKKGGIRFFRYRNEGGYGSITSGSERIEPSITETLKYRFQTDNSEIVKIKVVKKIPAQEELVAKTPDQISNFNIVVVKDNTDSSYRLVVSATTLSKDSKREIESEVFVNEAGERKITHGWGKEYKKRLLHYEEDHSIHPVETKRVWDYLSKRMQSS